MSTNLASTRPHIVISPGAFTPPDRFSVLISILRERGYVVQFAAHPSQDPVDPFTASAAKDVDYLRNEELIPILDAGHKVILYSHSYGGNIASSAARGLSSAARQRDGKQGGIIGLICCSCPLVPEGQTIEGFLGGLPPSMQRDQIEPRLGMVFNTASSTVHAATAFNTPIPRPAWADGELDGAKVYLRATEDPQLTPETHDKFIKATGTQWIVRDVPTAHDAHIESPSVVTDEIDHFVASLI